MKLVCIAVFSLVGAALSLGGAQYFQSRAIKAELAHAAQQLMGHAASMAAEVRLVVAIARASRAPSCTDEDLIGLRFLAFDVSAVQDVGRVENGLLRCTAHWGRLARPVPLPPGAVPLRDGLTGWDARLWAQARIVPDTRLASDATLVDGVLVLTRPVQLPMLLRPDSSIRAQIMTRDGRHILLKQDDDAGRLPPRLSAVAGEPQGAVGPHQLCMAFLALCAVVSHEGPVNVVSVSPAIALTVGTMGLLVGGGAGLAIWLHRQANRSLLHQLRRALRRGTIQVVYQPIVRLRDRRMMGVEALARWQDERGQPVPPDVFVKLAENEGLLGALTRHVVASVLAEHRDGLLGQDWFYISINVGVSDLLDPDFRTFLRAELARHGIASPRIALEITERSTSDLEAVRAVVQDYRCEGFRVLIDDFGTGYSGLAYLAKMAVDAVKVDKLFTQAVGTESLGALMLQQIGEMIGSVQGQLIFEGIETQAQADVLAQRYPDAQGQGWLWGRPDAKVPAPGAIL